MRDTAAAEKALTTSDYAFLAVRPADGELESPCMILGSHNAHGLSYALDGAGTFWADCHRWALIGSDQKALRVDKTWPPGMRELLKPDTLATIVNRPDPAAPDDSPGE